MSKIWNSLRYGSTKTKIFLWVIILLSIASAGALLSGIILNQLPVMAAGFVVGMATLITSQSVSLEKLETKGQRKRKRPNAKDGEKPEKRDGKGFSETEDENGEDAEGPQGDITIFNDLDEKKIKQVMRQYKVSRDHKLVIVDKCDSAKKRQCPAFIWQNKGVFHVLMIGKEPKEIVFATTQIKEIRYEKNVTAHPEKDYQAVHHSPFISKLFGEYLPAYNDKQVGDKLVFTKNLYVVKDDVRFTNTSAKNLLDILCVPVIVDDTVTRSERYHDYFKELYRISILCKDKVYTMEEYKIQAELLLVRMSQAENVPYTVFRQTLANMLRFHLITREMLALVEESRADGT